MRNLCPNVGAFSVVWQSHAFTLWQRRSCLLEDQSLNNFTKWWIKESLKMRIVDRILIPGRMCNNWSSPVRTQEKISVCYNHCLRIYTISAKKRKAPRAEPVHRHSLTMKIFCAVNELFPASLQDLILFFHIPRGWNLIYYTHLYLRYFHRSLCNVI